MCLEYTIHQPPLDRAAPVESVRVEDCRVYVRQNGYSYKSPKFATLKLAMEEGESFILESEA